VGEFQLILLNERERPVRARRFGAFSLVQFRSRIELEMAAENAAAKRITPETLASWLTPIQACAYAAQIVGAEKAANAIWERLAGGMIEAIAASTSVMDSDYTPDITREPTSIPKHYWKYCSDTGTDLWGAGDARFFITARALHSTRPRTIRRFGIKLNPEDVRGTLPPLPPESQRRWPPKETSPKTPATEVAQSANKGGRPRKDFWDDFWIDVCGQIYEGTLKPMRQADLEKAMLEWATNHGHEMSERATFASGLCN
jgi:hypothetical protein